jgi:hypothetical protein
LKNALASRWMAICLRRTDFPLAQAMRELISRSTGKRIETLFEGRYNTLVPAVCALPISLGRIFGGFSSHPSPSPSPPRGEGR